MKFFHRVPLVLLPGTGCNQLLWRQVLPLLSKHMMPVMPDLLACSSQQAMLQKVNELPFKKFMLMGFSMGGYIAQRFYAMHPERVSHLMLLCTSGEKKNVDASVIEQNLNRLKDKSYLSHMIHPINSKHKEELYAKITTMLDEAGPEAVGKQMHATAHRSAVLDQFPANPVPTLVIGARQDKVISKKHMENVALALKTEVDWLDSGHMLPLESPDELSLIINTWFARQHLMPEHEKKVPGTQVQGLAEEPSSKFTV
jgi:pimeloyl-ACP methyl ester carboxylesterase